MTTAKTELRVIPAGESALVQDNAVVVSSGAHKRSPGLLSRLSRWLDRSEHLPEPDDLKVLYTASLTDSNANQLARKWAAHYQAADGSERRSLLAVLVLAGAALDPREDQGTRLFKRLYAQSDSLALMVELRADMLRWRNQVAGLTVLEQELRNLLSNWFDVGMLELRHIDWDSPASMLERLIQYEAVHEIRSWDDMRRRVASDRRCFAFFHPRMPDIPVIFVEVAFANKLVTDVQTLLDPGKPISSLDKVKWAVFYSISSTQAGLRKISFGNFLLKRVIEELLVDLPQLKYFVTLSPIPGFAGWLEKQSNEEILKLLKKDKADQTFAKDLASGSDWLGVLRAKAGDPAAEEIGRCGVRLAARYLTQLRDNHPVDAVARFHLGNGARIERINWAANLSDKGLEQSCGMMVNYLYELDELDDNRTRLAAGKPRVSRDVQKL